MKQKTTKQIVGFMEELIQKVMDGSKTYTTRKATPFRKRLSVGSIMLIFSGNRTPAMKKHGEAIVERRWLWDQHIIYNAPENECPIPHLTWEEFAKVEGVTLQELIDWFSKVNYLREELLTYEFEVIEKIYD